MSILDIFIKPLEFVFEIIYSIASKFTSEPLLLILLLSICVNLLALPLYRRADIIQKEAREAEAQATQKKAEEEHKEPEPESPEKESE